jgi:predicted enzyme involved in methoxymalonyl-ACP biosynthesis
MVHAAVEHARRAGAVEVIATYRPTPRNAPMLGFWTERSGFERLDDEGPFRWNASQSYPRPPSLEIVGPEAAGQAHAAS